METKHWTVNWTHRDGKKGSTVIEWPSEPNRETAAIRIREPLLGKDYFLVDTPRGHTEPTVLLMEHYGYTIDSVEPADE
jgi:hypothetical protein